MLVFFIGPITTLHYKNFTDQCSPEYDSLNYCGYFVGLILVYGSSKNAAALDVHDMIAESLRAANNANGNAGNDDDFNNLVHPDLVQISLVKEFSRLDGLPLSLTREYRLSDMALAVVAIGIFVLAVFLLWYIVYTRKRYNILKSDGTITTTSRTGSWPRQEPNDEYQNRADDIMLWLRSNVGTSIRKSQRVGINDTTSNDSFSAPSDEERNSLKSPSMHDQSTRLFNESEGRVEEQSRVLLDNERPREIHFHPVISETRTYPCDNTSSGNSGTHQSRYERSYNTSIDTGNISLPPSMRSFFEA